MSKPSLLQFISDISLVMELIENKEELAARHKFNTQVFDKHKDHLPNFAVPLWVALDEYFNDEYRRDLDPLTSSRANVLSEFADFKEEVRKIKDY